MMFVAPVGQSHNQVVNEAPSCSMKDLRVNFTDNIPIAKNVLAICKIPKCQQLDGIAAVDPSLDATLCGKWNNQELCVVVWLLTRITPNFKITDLRCRTYQETADHQME